VCVGGGEGGWEFGWVGVGMGWWLRVVYVWE